MNERLHDLGRQEEEISGEREREKFVTLLTHVCLKLDDHQSRMTPNDLGWHENHLFHGCSQAIGGNF